MGLLLGASVLTIFEVLDLVIYNSLRKSCRAGKLKTKKAPAVKNKDAEQPAITAGNHTNADLKNNVNTFT